MIDQGHAQKQPKGCCKIPWGLVKPVLALLAGGAMVHAAHVMNPPATPAPVIKLECPKANLSCPQPKFNITPYEVGGRK